MIFYNLQIYIQMVFLLCVLYLYVYLNYPSDQKLYHIQNMPLYVNRGIGTKTREIRLLCRPEITVLEVQQ